MAKGENKEVKKLKKKTDEQIIMMYLDQLKTMTECSLMINALGITMGERNINVNGAKMSIALNCKNSNGKKRIFKLAEV